MVAKFGASVIYGNNYPTRKNSPRAIVNFGVNTDNGKDSENKEQSFIQKHWLKTLMAASAIGAGTFLLVKFKKTLPVQSNILSGYEKLCKEYQEFITKNNIAFDAPKLDFKKFDKNLKLIEHNPNDNIIYVNESLLKPGKLVICMKKNEPIKIALKEELSGTKEYSILNLTDQEIASKVLGDLAYEIERNFQNQLMANYADLEKVAIKAARNSGHSKGIKQTDIEILDELKKQKPYLFKLEANKRLLENNTAYIFGTEEITLKNLVEDTFNEASTQGICVKSAKMKQLQIIKEHIGTIAATTSNAKKAMVGELNELKL